MISDHLLPTSFSYSPTYLSKHSPVIHFDPYFHFTYTQVIFGPVAAHLSRESREMNGTRRRRRSIRPLGTGAKRANPGRGMGTRGAGWEWVSSKRSDGWHFAPLRQNMSWRRSTSYRQQDSRRKIVHVMYLRCIAAREK